MCHTNQGRRRRLPANPPSADGNGYSMLRGAISTAALSRDDRGQTVMEYALIIAILVIGMVATINNFGTGILTMAADRVDVLVP